MKENEEVKKIYHVFLTLMSMMVFANSLFAPIFFPYMLNKGIETHEANMVLATTMITIFLLEIPTGAVADIVGRKRSFILSLFLMSISKIIFFFSGSLHMFMAGAFIDGIAFAFNSGSIDAWMIDEVKAKGVEKYKDIFATNAKYCKMASVVAGGIGGLILMYNQSLVWIISAAILMVASFLAQTMIEETTFKKLEYDGNIKNGFKAFKNTCISSFSLIKNNMSLSLLIMISSLDMLLFGGVAHLWTVRFTDELNMGWIISIMWVVLAIGSIIGNSIIKNDKLNIQEGKLNIVLISSTFVSMCFILAGISGSGYMIAFIFFIKNIFNGVKKPLLNAYFNENIDSEFRATIISFKSLSVSLFHNIGLFVMGFVILKYSISIAWVIAGVVSIVVIPTTIIYVSREKSEIRQETN